MRTLIEPKPGRECADASRQTWGRAMGQLPLRESVQVFNVGHCGSSLLLGRSVGFCGDCLTGRPAKFSSVSVLASQTFDLSALVGQTFYAQWNCFTDDSFVVPFRLSDYTFEVELTPPGVTPITLTPGSGLTIDATNGFLQVEADTTGWLVGQGRWFMRATDADGAISYPLRGVLSVGNP